MGYFGTYKQSKPTKGKELKSQPELKKKIVSNPKQSTSLYQQQKPPIQQKGKEESKIKNNLNSKSISKDKETKEKQNINENVKPQQSKIEHQLPPSKAQEKEKKQEQEEKDSDDGWQKVQTFQPMKEKNTKTISNQNNEGYQKNVQDYKKKQDVKYQNTQEWIGETKLRKDQEEKTNQLEQQQKEKQLQNYQNDIQMYKMLKAGLQKKQVDSEHSYNEQTKKIYPNQLKNGYEMMQEQDKGQSSFSNDKRKVNDDSEQKLKDYKDDIERYKQLQQNNKNGIPEKIDNKNQKPQKQNPSINTKTGSSNSQPLNKKTTQTSLPLISKSSTSTTQKNTTGSSTKKSKYSYISKYY